MIKAILYDMDGTILDTMPLYDLGWKKADEVFGYNGRAAALIAPCAGMTSAQVAASLRAELGADFPAEDYLKKLFEAFEVEINARGVSCKKGAEDIFAAARKIGARQVLCTSSTADHVKPYLKMAGIDGVFDAVITGDMVKRSKPAPDIFLMGAEAVGCAPEECIVVEDAANGVRAGLAAGIRVAMIPEYPPVPEDIRERLWHECADLSELAELVLAESV